MFSNRTAFYPSFLPITVTSLSHSLFMGDFVRNFPWSEILLYLQAKTITVSWMLTKDGGGGKDQLSPRRLLLPREKEAFAIC